MSKDEAACEAAHGAGAKRKQELRSLAHNGLLTIWPYRHNAYRQLDQLRDPIDVATCGSRQVAGIARSADLLLPPWQRLVNRLAALQQERVAGEIGRALAVQLVGGADLELVN